MTTAFAGETTSATTQAATLLGVASFGVRIGVQISNPKMVDKVVHFLPPGWNEVKDTEYRRIYSIIQKPTEDGVELYSDGHFIASRDDTDSLLTAFQSHLQLYVAEMATNRLFVHAGCVAWCGKAVMLPGSSFSGKTMLVAALVAAGAVYYSDEYATLDSEGLVHPYGRALSIREPNGKRRRCTAEELGGVSGVEPLRVGAILFSSYRCGAEWNPRALSTGEGLIELLCNTVPARSRPQSALAILHKSVASAIILKGERGEAETTALAILNENRL